MPDFPATKSEIKKVVTERLRGGVYRETALLSRLRKFQAHEGDSFSIHRADGTVEKSRYRETAVEMTIDKKDLATLSPGALVEKIDKMAMQMAEKTSTAMFEKLHEVTTEAGRVHDAGGKPFSPDTLLEALEMMDIDPGTTRDVDVDLARDLEKAARASKETRVTRVEAA